MKYPNQILCILFFLCSTIAFAQKEISNQVVDFFKDEPIESASVYLKSTAIGTITNADGKFVLRIPEENAVDTLMVSSIGYSTEKIPLDQYDPSEPIYLVEAVASLDEVVLEAEIRPKQETILF